MEFIHGILERVEPNILKRIYKVGSWKDTEDFVSQCAKNYGKLIKGGEPDLKATSKIILMDQRKIPYFIEPPKSDENNVIDDKGINFEKEKDMNEKFGIKQNIDDINVKDIEGNNNDNLIEENME